jgi:hypothetical protein
MGEQDHQGPESREVRQEEIEAGIVGKAGDPLDRETVA